jgi:hypothetical protein
MTSQYSQQFGNKHKPTKVEDLKKPHDVPKTPKGPKGPDGGVAAKVRV